MYRVFIWSAFLDLAEELAALPANEAAARTAISRAYYATFHAGRAYLDRSNVLINRSRQTHVQVQVALQMRNTEIGQIVAVLHTWRKQADYDSPNIPDFDEMAQSAVALARETIAAIERLP